jgi:hypothetical protein
MQTPRVIVARRALEASLDRVRRVVAQDLTVTECDALIDVLKAQIDLLGTELANVFRNKEAALRSTRVDLEEKPRIFRGEDS